MSSAEVALMFLPRSENTFELIADVVESDDDKTQRKKLDRTLRNARGGDGGKKTAHELDNRVHALRCLENFRTAATDPCALSVTRGQSGEAQCCSK